MKPIAEVLLRERRVTALVPYAVPGDSATMQALFECDSMNNVLLKSMTEEKGNRASTSFSYKKGKFAYKIEIKPDTVYLPSDTTYIEKEVPVYVEQVEYRQTKLQHLFYLIGIVVTALLSGWLFLKLKRLLKL